VLRGSFSLQILQRIILNAFNRPEMSVSVDVTGFSMIIVNNYYPLRYTEADHDERLEYRSNC